MLSLSFPGADFVGSSEILGSVCFTSQMRRWMSGAPVPSQGLVRVLSKSFGWDLVQIGLESCATRQRTCAKVLSAPLVGWCENGFWEVPVCG